MLNSTEEEVLLTTEEYEHYLKNSWITKENHIDSFLMNEVIETFLFLCEKFSPRIFENIHNSSINNIEIHNRIIDFRRTNPKLFGKVYEIMQSSLSIKRIALSNKIRNLASLLLNTIPSRMMLRNSIMRIDVPKDKRNILNWHYDEYVDGLSNHKSKGGVTIVIPLTDFSEKNGAPIICEGSHNNSPEQKCIENKDMNTNTYGISKSYIDSYKKKILTSIAGTAIAFPMCSVHRSGFNSSGMIRLSCLLRYYSYEYEDYLPLKESFDLLK